MKKYFSVAMLIIGTIIGAGFASGRELVSFFGNRISPFTAVLCGMAIFVLSVVFLFIGSRLRSTNVSEVNRKLAGRAHVVVDSFLLVNNFIVLAGMLAGMDSLGNLVLKIRPAWSILSGALCVFVVCRGIKGLLNCNSLVVPLIIVSMIFVCAYSAAGGGMPVREFQSKTLLTLVVYVCMNMMLASTVLTTMGEMSKKQIFVSSAIAAFIMTVLILLLILALNNNPFESADMPVLEMARKISPIVFGLILVVIAVSIFTTMLTAMSGLVAWFSSVFGSRLYSAVFVLLLALALSNLGFSNLVGYLYPVIGVLGVIYTVLCLVYVVREAASAKACRKFFHKRDSEVHKRGKNAKNKRRRHNEVELENLTAVNDKVPESRRRNKIFAHDNADPR